MTYISTIDQYKTYSGTSNDLYNNGVKKKIFMFLLYTSWLN